VFSMVTRELHTHRIIPDHPGIDLFLVQANKNTYHFIQRCPLLRDRGRCRRQFMQTVLQFVDGRSKGSGTFGTSPYQEKAFVLPFLFVL
jgi:hypothetical protein